MAAVNGLLLSGRLALVTEIDKLIDESKQIVKNHYDEVGGASGIGRAICQTLAKAGASVAVVDRNIEGAVETGNSLLKIDGNQLHSKHATDVASSLQVNELILKVQEDHQRPPCILVNSAGITRDAFFLKMNEEAFDDVIDVNLKGTFLVSQFASKAMLESKISNGSIINIASIVGKTGNIGQANYAASKAGVEGLTRTCALELARFGIRCNAVLPGFIHSPMTEKIPEQITQKVVKMVPLGRIGQPSEIAEVINFLASDLSSYITGASIEVTGGLSM